MPVKLPAAYLMPLRQSAVSETLMFDFKGKLERSVGAGLPPHPDVRACVSYEPRGLCRQRLCSSGNMATHVNTATAEGQSCSQAHVLLSVSPEQAGLHARLRDIVPHTRTAWSTS